MLDALAGLQADGDDPVAAMATWQTVLSREPDETTAAGIVGRMRKALARSLAPDNADAVDPVTALVLLKTFPLLLPDAEPGRRLVYGVAARLAEAGLPAQAAGLLDEHHARAGPPAASGLLELARYQLAADEANAARATVSRVDVKGDALAADRRVTEAEALLALGRAGDALRLLEGHSGANVLRLRARDVATRGLVSPARGALV
jgi:hypothetical protein